MCAAAAAAAEKKLNGTRETPAFDGAAHECAYDVQWAGATSEHSMCDNACVECVCECVYVFHKHNHHMCVVESESTVANEYSANA